MIGKIRGILIEKQAPFLLVDVMGVGYEIEAPMSTIYQLPEIGSEVNLYTHFVVREDAQLLYGFHDKHERSLFRALIKINGVGPKLGLTILSGIDSAEFVRCVEEQDTQTLVKLPGVGKKTAERLVIEMRDRLSALQEQDLKSKLVPGIRPSLSVKSRHGEIADAESALIALGFKPAEASRAIAKLEVDSLNSEEIIRQALKNMVSR